MYYLKKIIGEIIKDFSFFVIYKYKNKNIKSYEDID